MGGAEVAAGRGLTVSVSNVLDRVVEGYLLGDLESMATEIRDKEVGAVGYPIVMAVLAGCELLGAMTNEKKHNLITSYWKAFMGEVDERYAYLGEIATDLRAERHRAPVPQPRRRESCPRWPRQASRAVGRRGDLRRRRATQRLPAVIRGSRAPIHPGPCEARPAAG